MLFPDKYLSSDLQCLVGTHCNDWKLRYSCAWNYPCPRYCRCCRYITYQKVCRPSEYKSYGTTPHDVLLIVQIPPMVTVNRFAPPARAIRAEGLQAPYSPGETSRRLTGNLRNKGNPASNPYLIFVIFFTQSNFLENKIYTEKSQFFALNL